LHLSERTNENPLAVSTH